MTEVGKDADQQTDEFTTALEQYHDSLGELDRLRNQNFRRTLSNISLFFYDRVPKETEAELSIFQKEGRIYDLLKQRAGCYSLTDIAYKLYRLHEEEEPKIKGRFVFSFSWTDEKTGRDFRPEFAIDNIRVVRTKKDRPEVEVVPGAEPLLHVPEGFTIPISLESLNRPGTYDFMKPSYGLWKPQISDEVRTITIPWDKEAIFTFDPKKAEFFEDTKFIRD